MGAFLTKLGAFFGQSPPAWVLWLGVSVAIINAFVAIASFVYTTRNETKKRKQSVDDDFWYREIAGPFFIEPFFTFLTEQLSAYEKYALTAMPPTGAADPAADKLLTDFRAAKKVVRCRLNFLKAVDLASHKAVTETLRNLEDKITVYCAYHCGVGGTSDYEPVSKDAMVQQFETAISDSIATLRSSHQKMVLA